MIQSSNTNTYKTQVAVIGAGITGCAIARELSRYSIETLVLDREADVGWGTTKANTGLIHPGYAGEEGTLRLSLSRKGQKLFVKNAEELSIPIKPPNTKAKINRIIICCTVNIISSSTLLNLKVRLNFQIQIGNYSSSIKLVS